MYAEVIEKFDVHIDLKEGGYFTVTENILYDFESAHRHGIFRTIPTSHPQDESTWYKERYIDIEVISVLMDGRQVPYNISTSGKNTEVKIGDPNKTITGSHTYTIVYNVEGALFQVDDTVELYWNVTGDRWRVPIETVRAEVHASSGMLETAQACYIGVVESTKRCTVGRRNDHMTLFVGNSLSPGEGVTIAQALDPHVVDVMMLDRTRYEIFILIAIFITIFGGALWLSHSQLKHKTGKSIIAQYDPYAEIRPMYAGYVIDGMLHPRDVTAGIVYLAEQGFVRIKKIQKKFLFFNMSDYEVTLLKDPDEISGEFLPRVIELLFGHRGVGNTVTLSDIKQNYSKQKINRQILRELKKALSHDMEQQGLYERYGWWRMLRRRTRKGYDAMNHLKGFKEYLSVTGKDRFKFHNAPDKNPQTFLEYLPYAIAFGVEKEWAHVFEDVIIPNPGWYDSGSVGAFSATGFSSDMRAFSSSLATSSGTSASSGGGSAGGGAGGGGGGSW